MTAICYFCLFLQGMIHPPSPLYSSYTVLCFLKFSCFRVQTHPLVSLVLSRVSDLPLHLFLELQGLKVQETEGAG